MTEFNYPFGFFFLFAIALLWPGEMLTGQSIWIDESYEDWEVYTPIHQDKAGDGAPNGVDFTRLKMTNSEKYLFFYLEVGREILFQDNNALHLYIDLDNNPLTGAEEHGIGAEIVFHFGGRTGKFYSPFGVVDLSQNSLQLITAPAVSSHLFEFSIARDLLIAGQTLSLDGSISVVFSDERTQGDRIPDALGGISYTFAPDASHTLPPYTLAKRPEDAFRLMAYNVRRDDLFNPSLRENYRRIFNAVQPDLLAFSEIYDYSALETAQQVEILYPAGGEQTWYFGGVNPDIRLISRYPILDMESLDGNGVFHLRKGNQDLLVIVTHLPCCDNNNARQREIDRIMAFVRDVRWSQSNFQIPPHTPILITGDKNFVGPRQQVRTLLYGDIVNTQTFGLGLLPDWNDQPLADAKPYTTGTPFAYTWRSANSGYNPGRLDYIAFTSSVLQLNNAFALSTENMPLDSLTLWGLQAQDTERASDHLPVVADFAWKPTTLSQTPAARGPEIFWKIYPNPSQNWFRIEVSPQAIQEDWQLLIEDTQGRVLQRTPLPGGRIHRDVFFALPRGVYLVRALGSSTWLPPKILLVQP
jgi:endonuclease/exonuclease/phosphatase family metal-dependent hydrolase